MKHKETLLNLFPKPLVVIENLFFGHKKLNEFSISTKGLWIMKKDGKNRWVK